MEDWTQTLGTVPLLFIASGGVALILFLIIVVRLHAFVVLVLVSLLTAATAGIPAEHIVPAMLDGFGSTLASVALVVSFGAILGRLLEASGGARVIAERMVAVFGQKRAALALGASSLIMGIPMFADAGIVVMIPIVFAVARRMGGRSLLLYGISSAAAFSIMHVLVPPHPGPVMASEFFGANIGLVLVFGLLIALPVWYVSGYLWARLVNARYPMVIPTLFGALDDDQPQTPPRVGWVIFILVLPMMLILLNTGFDTLSSAGVVDAETTWVKVVMVIGASPVALLISVLVAILVLGKFRGESGSALEKLVDGAFGPVASVILITGAGGMFGGVLRSSGIGDALYASLDGLGLPVVIAAYVISVALRVAQGSATVAIATTGGLLGTAVSAGNFNEIELVCIVLAAAAGSRFASHVNDSAFWLVGNLLKMDVKTTLKTWTVQSTIESLLSFAAVLLIYTISGGF
ncbi:GntP family permease [Brevibacterium permense]|uniref:GntP family permease n=1 Tax=Brevibacterium permense TaxID=234834 RepID=UPI0021D21412|nr:GntP family permease [Brevibacterium permense]MCU4298834.1 GntP family permease [Brevibacterium permense]